MSYQSRLAVYEMVKKDIARTSKSPEEYTRRIKALVNKLKI